MQQKIPYFLSFFCYFWSPYVHIYFSMIGWFCFLFYSNDKNTGRKVKKSGRQKTHIPKISSHIFYCANAMGKNMGRIFWPSLFSVFFLLFVVVLCLHIFINDWLILFSFLLKQQEYLKKGKKIWASKNSDSKNLGRNFSPSFKTFFNPIIHLSLIFVFIT